MSHSTRQIEPNMQKRHTNIAVVRVKKGGKKFELACYKNKILNWRNGVETNVEDVLQIKDIFKDVSTGERCRKQDLQKVFKTKSIQEIMKYILDKGDLQLSAKEREHILQNKWNEIVSFLSDQCLNPVTKRPYPYGFIDSEMKKMHFSVNPNKNTKMQALKCLKKLKSRIDIIRARMQVSITYPRTDRKEVSSFIKTHPNSCEVVERKNDDDHKSPDPSSSDHITKELWIDPGLFRILREKIEGFGGEIRILLTGLEENENDLIDIFKIKDDEDLVSPKKKKNEEADDEERENKSRKKNKKDQQQQKQQQQQQGRRNRKKNRKKNKRRFDVSSEEEDQGESKENSMDEDDDKEENVPKRKLTKQEKRKFRREKRKRKKEMKNQQNENDDDNSQNNVNRQSKRQQRQQKKKKKRGKK